MTTLTDIKNACWWESFLSITGIVEQTMMNESQKTTIVSRHGTPTLLSRIVRTGETHELMQVTSAYLLLAVSCSK